MKFLYNQLGDWYLAMAAYDWGAGNVQRAGREDRLCRFLGALQAQQPARRNQELRAGNSRRHHHRQSPHAVRLRRHHARSARHHRHRDHQLLRRSAPGVGPGGRAGGRVDGPESQPAALHHSARRSRSICICPRERPRSSSSASPQSPRASAIRGAIIASPPTTRWPRWRASFHVQVSELAAANQMSENDSLDGVEALVVPVAPSAAPSSRGMSLHHAQGRHAGFHRRPFRRFAQPVAPLEQAHRHQGCAGPPAARSRTRARGPRRASLRRRGSSAAEFPARSRTRIKG